MQFAAKNLRERLKMPVGAFAELMGVEERTVFRWESPTGSRPVGTPEALMTGIQEALDLNPDRSDEIVAFIRGSVEVGGLAYLMIKLLDLAKTPSRNT